MRCRIIFAFTLMSIIVFSISSQDIFAQTYEQNTITGDLSNDPVAQDILEKIEKTKRWIKLIEKRTSDRADIEEKKKEVQAILETKLLEFKKKWEQFTFEYRLEEMRKKTTPDFIEKNWQNNTAGMNTYQKTIKSGGTIEEAQTAAIQITTRIYSIFLDNFNYTYSKIKEGQEAMRIILDNGGTGKQAQAAYAQAAQMKISDLIAINAINNAKYNMAYYNQQILFEAEGQFDDLKSGESLREYYQDYRMNPAYILANPKDTSWKNIGQTRINIECIDDKVLVYRSHSDDYVCTTEATAEMWEKHDIGEIVQKNLNPYDLSIEQLHEDRINSKINNAEKKLKSIHNSHLYKITDLDKKYEEMYIEMESEKQAEEKSARNDNQLLEIENRYQTLVNIMNKDKNYFVQLVKKSQTESYQELIRLYEDDKDVKIIWNYDDADYEVLENESYFVI